ncbi:MAG: phage major capsid protein [Candidatus Solibacter sp.]|nr:phage major capsid protein [Candidatus Solibacter sp.]
MSKRLIYGSFEGSDDDNGRLRPHLSPLQQARAKVERYFDTARSILDKAKAEGRDLTAAEKRDLDGLEVKMDAARQEANRAQGHAAAAADEAFRRLEGHGSSNILRPGESFARACAAIHNEPAGRGVDFGKLVRGMVTGNWRGADLERESISNEALAGGGFTLPVSVSSRIIDAARAASVVTQAGALTVPMEDRTLKLARMLTDFAPQWRDENAAITEGTPTFDGVTLTAKTLACLAKVSVELVEDAANLEDVLYSAMGAAIGLEMDRVALLGSGEGQEPAGITETDGIGTVNLWGTGEGQELDGYWPIVRGIRECAINNFAPNAVIMSPRDYFTLDELTDGTGQPLRAPQSVEAVKRFMTNSIPTNLGETPVNDASLMVTGLFSELLYGIRTRLVLEASRSAADSTGSAFSQMQVWLRAYVRMDLAVLRPKAFTVISGIRPFLGEEA